MYLTTNLIKDHVFSGTKSIRLHLKRSQLCCSLCNMCLTKIIFDRIKILRIFFPIQSLLGAYVIRHALQNMKSLFKIKQQSNQLQMKFAP